MEFYTEFHMEKVEGVVNYLLHPSFPLTFRWQYDLLTIKPLLDSFVSMCIYVELMMQLVTNLLFHQEDCGLTIQYNVHTPKLSSGSTHQVLLSKDMNFRYLHTQMVPKCPRVTPRAWGMLTMSQDA